MKLDAIELERSKILAEADDCVTRDRASAYGPAENHFQAIADLWNWWFGSPEYLEPRDVAMMLALLKIARIRGNTEHRDSYVDLCGYAAIAGEIGGSR